MKKAAAILMVLAMTLPVFAQPACAAGCGGSATVAGACCCGLKAAPTDGLDSYSSTPCCASGTARGDLSDLDSAVPTVQTTVAGNTGIPVPAPALTAAATGAPELRAALAAPAAEARPPGTSILLRSSVLRL